ncbi:MAG: hypothetical protein HQ592_16445 [Planctomycetes bacterium]|nr:hypothetical protein [Planctomycetota bacterium]
MRKWHNTQANTSHDVTTDDLGRTTKYVYENPETGNAVMVLNCSQQLDKEFAQCDTEVRASVNLEQPADEENPVMKLSIVVMIRKNVAGAQSEQQKA